MIKNFIKTAFRNLTKSKGFSAINVSGLALGLATCLLIVFYVFDELSYDRYNVNANRIFRLNSEIKFGGDQNLYAVTPAPAAAALKADFPEIEQVARLRNTSSKQVRKGNQDITEERIIFADNAIFSIFTLPMLSGNPARALTEPHTVVITESTARKYFNGLNVVGRVLTFNDTAQYKITGVIKDIPPQSHFHFDFFLSMPSNADNRNPSWFSNNYNTYLLLRPDANPAKLQSRFRDFIRKHAAGQLQTMLHLNFDNFERAGNYFRLSLFPLSKIHLGSNGVAELDANGNIRYIYLFSAIALFILLLACVNFMNLSTARSSNRAREVGVRKVLGSPRKYLIAQFLTESVLITLAAAVIAVFAAWAVLPFFNNIAGKQLVVTTRIVVWLIPVLAVFVMVVGCLAGSYPALFLSGFRPIEVLKGKLSAGFKGGKLRSFLVIFQFAVSIFLTIGTIVIYNHTKFIQNKDLGYKRDHVLIIKDVWTLRNQAKTFKQEVLGIAGVQNATLTGALPTAGYQDNTTFFKDPVLDQKRAVLSEFWSVDEDYVPALSIKMVAGRNFSKRMVTDSSGLIINEAAAKQLGLADPINQFLYAPMDPMAKTIKKFHIVGIMKDFNYRSLRDNIAPLILTLSEERGALSLKVNTANLPLLISQLKSKWNGLAPGQQLNYSFMDEEFDALYRSEQRMGTIFITFTSLAIIIACLGLFGLAAYATEQRTKEIGIRKILGARMATIVAMLSGDFIKLVLVAMIISSPLAWWAMHSWLQGFAYRQNIQWWVVALAGLSAMVIAFATISYQATKAALTNPVKSLRSE